MRTPNKEELLKPKLLRQIERLKTLIEMNAPPSVVGLQAWSLYRCTLAAYGRDAAEMAVSEIYAYALRESCTCYNDDCTNPVPYEDPTGVCDDCKKELGIMDVERLKFTLVDCPNCGQPVNVDETSCRNCGHELRR